MKRLLSLVAIFATLQASAQQVNPVPDYVFSNRMSAGRNTVTDTAAYFSIGPRYGATRGMMPPMVVDTASFSANKRNGLLIFSVQKNKFLYWDSVGVKWAEMAGTGGSAITGSGVAGYMPEFTTTTNLDTTRLYHSAGRFAIGSTTTSNGVFNVYSGISYFDTSLRVGSSTLFADEANGSVGIGTTSPVTKLDVQDGDISVTRQSVISHFNSNRNVVPSGGSFFLGGLRYRAYSTGTTYQTGAQIFAYTSAAWSSTSTPGFLSFHTTPSASTTPVERMVIDQAGSVGIGLTLPTSKLDVLDGDISVNTLNSFSFFNTNRNTNPSGSGTSLGGIRYRAYSTGATYQVGAQILSFTGGAWTSTSSPGYLSFQTTQSSSISPTERMILTSDGELLVNTGTDNGDYRLQVNGNAEIRGNIRTSAPAGGTANDWRLGTVATVSPTSPNRTIEVSIGGTIYYIHAKTTND